MASSNEIKLTGDSGTMTIHNKLVRDRIPAIIISNGQEPLYSAISDDERYLAALWDKVYEEIREFKATPTTEEMADIMTILLAVMDYHGIAFEDVLVSEKEKTAKLGGFKDRIMLGAVISRSKKRCS